MSAMHTPGPWSVGNEGRFLICTLSPKVCVYADEMVKTDAEHDARLIAAAPELLDALDQITGVYESMRETLAAKYPDDGWSAETMSIDKARAAIAKATGSTS